MESKNELLLSVKNGTHPQFFLDNKESQVKCKCGCKAVWWKTGYLCGSITAYPCKF
jgi:hypothetical protein